MKATARAQHVSNSYTTAEADFLSNLISQVEKGRASPSNSITRANRLGLDASLGWFYIGDRSRNDYAVAARQSGKRPYAHSGEEFGLIFEGEITLILGSEIHTLRRRDAVTFGSDIPHLWENRTRTTFRMVIVSPPFAREFYVRISASCLRRPCSRKATLGRVTLGLPAAIFRYSAITAASIILRDSSVIGQAMS
jgi:uncharacterized cupin superfamily protein